MFHRQVSGCSLTHQGLVALNHFAFTYIVRRIFCITDFQSGGIILEIKLSILLKNCSLLSFSPKFFWSMGYLASLMLVKFSMLYIRAVNSWMTSIFSSKKCQSRSLLLFTCLFYLLLANIITNIYLSDPFPKMFLSHTIFYQLKNF